MGENRARASDSVIHPRSPTGRALSDADSASSSTALSLRASGGTDVPGANAALMVFHIPIAGRYIAALQGTTPASLGGMLRVACFSRQGPAYWSPQSGLVRNSAAPYRLAFGRYRRRKSDVRFERCGSPPIRASQVLAETP